MPMSQVVVIAYDQEGRFVDLHRCDYQAKQNIDEECFQADCESIVRKINSLLKNNVDCVEVMFSRQLRITVFNKESYKRRVEREVFEAMKQMLEASQE